MTRSDYNAHLDRKLAELDQALSAARIRLEACKETKSYKKARKHQEKQDKRLERARRAQEKLAERQENLDRVLDDLLIG